ncbi:MAG: hypothetical protein ABI680_01175 [Chthoniobacteraceae bacterium]
MKISRTFGPTIASVVATSVLAASAMADHPVELVFPSEIEEVEAIFLSASKQPLVADQNLIKAELLKAYNATDEPLEHRDSQSARVAESHAPEVLAGSTQNIMLWGPYAELDPGHYLVIYRFQVTDPEAAHDDIFLDVSHNACTRSGIRIKASEQPAGKWREVAVPVYLPEKMKLEYRVWPGGNAMALDRIYLFKVAPGPQDEKRDEGLKDLPEGEPVPGRDDVVTSPHTDNPGQIDISGLKKGARVRCPYTGNYFRVP